MERPRIKNKRILRERIEKFISPIYFADVNLHSKLYKHISAVPSILHFAAPGRITHDDAISNLDVYNEVSVGTSFGPSWSTHWFKLDIDLSSCTEWIGHQLRLRWNSNSEALVWQDGVPKQGLTGGDNSERWDYILTNNCCGKEKMTIFIEMAANGLFGAGANSMIGPPDPNKSFTLSKLEIAVLDKDIYRIVQDLKILIDMAQTLPEENDLVDKALQVGCDVANCFQPEKSNSAEKALSILDFFFNGDAGGTDRHQYKIHAMGHCHIDTAWLWPYAETKRKCARSWSSSIGLMKRYPEFTFTCSQAVQLLWVEENYPELFKEIQVYTKKGQFLPTGGTWVEMDGNVPSGESFIRQFMYGQKFFKEHFGFYCDVFWLPDTFGYSAQLPQIAKSCAIKYFLTQKISWSLINTFPHNSFVWQGIDGTKLLTHFPPADTYESNCSFKDIYKTSKQNKDKGVVSEGVLLYGFGDGGGGPSEDMLENLSRLGSINGLPKIEHSTPTKFFQSLEKVQKKLHTWVGELYLELHQGTFTTQAQIKKNNRQLEHFLYNVEFLHVFASLQCLKEGTDSSFGANLHERIEECWKNILLNQFHDVLPGSSIKLVNDDAIQIYKDTWVEAMKLTKELMKSLFGSSGDPGGEEIILNTLSFQRTELVEDEEKNLHFVCVPPHGYKTLTECVVQKHIPVTVSESDGSSFVLQNTHLKATFNSCGQLTSCILLRNNREAVLPGQMCNQFLTYTDIPLYWDAWDIMPYTNETGEVLSKFQNVETFNHGSLRAGIKFTLKISDKSEIRQTISLDAESKFLRFETEVDWHENRKLLRVAFPMNVHTNQATYDIQCGHIQRTTSVNTSWDWAKHEVCGHKWADLSEYGFGVSLLNDCKYGFTAYGSTLQMSLLRSPKAPDDEVDMGTHSFSYAFMPHVGSFQSAQVNFTAHCFNNPLIWLQSGKKVNDLSSLSLFTIDNHAVVIQAIKMHNNKEKNVILRLHESHGGNSDVLITSYHAFQDVARVNSLEEVDETLSSVSNCVEKLNANNASVKVKPFEIITLSFQF
eukprot:TCONS_00065842-protein